MTRFWTRTRRFMTLLWLGTIVAEVVVVEMMRRTNNSWLLLLALALLLIPVAAMDATWRWFGREPRKRWKRHDVEDALEAGAAAAAASAAQPGTRP